MTAAEIHPQLLEDCHHLGSLPATELLLQRNSLLPWFILVPDTRLDDLLDLPAEHLQAVMQDCSAVSAFVKQVMGYRKLNFAGLGNVVPQMHLHVIGRSDTDPCWPRPVWGALPAGDDYTPAQLRQLQGELQQMTGLVPSASLGEGA